MKVYTTAELAELFHCNRRNIGKMRKYGLLHGIRVGHGYKFSEEEVNQFLEKYMGYSLRNDYEIRLAAQINEHI